MSELGGASGGSDHCSAEPSQRGSITCIESTRAEYEPLLFPVVLLAVLSIEEVSRAATIVWNGPMGVFEMSPFAKGTFKIAHAVADNAGATSIVGGGDSVSAVKAAGVADKISHISTGGGASLEFLEGKQLPGVEALTSKH